MDCMLTDDACFMKAMFGYDMVTEQRVVLDKLYPLTYLGDFNGRKHSMLIMDGKPVIVIEDGDRPTIYLVGD